MKKIQTLGMRINNPACIRYVSSNKWKGQIGAYKGFAQFSELRYGIRALIKVLRTYKKILGISFTLTSLIARYAPPYDNNDTRAYIDYVVRVTNINPTTPLTLDDDNLYLICHAICSYESSLYLTRSVFNDALKLT